MVDILHLDDLGTEVGEDLGGERAGPYDAEIEYANAFQGSLDVLFTFPLTCNAIG